MCDVENVSSLHFILEYISHDRRDKPCLCECLRASQKRVRKGASMYQISHLADFF